VAGRLGPSRELSDSETAIRRVVLSRVITDAKGLCPSEGPGRGDFFDLLGDFQSFLAAKIMSPSGLPIGCLCVCDGKKRRYGRSQVDTITALAHHCSVILVRLEASTKARFDLEESDALFETARIAVVSADLENGTVRGSPAFYRNYGLQFQFGQSIPREVLSPLVHPSDVKALTLIAAESVRTGLPYDVQFRSTNGAGGWRWQLLRGSARCDLPGVAPRLLGVLVDIDEQKRAELDLFETKERMRVTLSSIGDAVISTDADGCITFMNPVAEDMTGWSSADASGRMIEDVMDLRDSGSHQVAANPIRSAMRDRRLVGMAPDCRLVSRSGSEFQVEDCAAPIRRGDGDVLGGVIVFHDVTEVRAMAVRMSHLAQLDALTDLPNRVLLADRLDLALAHAQRRGERFALLFLDLDGFKKINDTAGHTAGDELLRHVAHRLVQTVRSDDTVSRQGGDEFIVLVSDVGTAEYASRLCQRILDAVGEPFCIEVAGQPAQVNTTFSIGAAIYPEDGDTADSLLRRADVAMYLAKQSGRNQYRFFDPEIDEGITARHALLDEIRHALDRDEFSLEYQPKFAAGTRRIVGLEALLRWRKEGGRSIPPAEFIPLAEESGLIVPIGEFVVRSVCRQARAWMEEGFREVPISVNVSPVQLLEPRFLSMMEDSCLPGSYKPANLQLEITETSLIANATVAWRVLTCVRALGMRISLDDYGTGFSSLSNLQNFPLDEIKVDRSFVSGRSANQADATIVAAICNVGRNLNLNVVAEGVETEEQAQALEALGCNELQGFLLSPPLSAADVRRFLSEADPPAADPAELEQPA
jgi:diguanylate cyclase (GGDEF)-like protein/PAS domain S-box-containing protein